MLRTISNVLAVFVTAPILSCLTGWIVMGRDSSQVGTVGDIELHGFPVWFRETAPGYSIVDGLHLERWGINTFIWAVALAGIIWLSARLLKRPG